MGVVEPVDQMKVSGTATPRADGQTSREMGFRASGKGGCFFMTYVNPPNLLLSANRVGDAVADVGVVRRDAGRRRVEIGRVAQRVPRDVRAVARAIREIPRVVVERGIELERRADDRPVEPIVVGGRSGVDNGRRRRDAPNRRGEQG